MGRLERLIRFSLRHRWLIVAAAALLTAVGGAWIATLPVDIFPDLSAPTVTVIGQKLIRNEYNAGQQIVTEGEDASHLYLLASGQVSIRLALPAGKIKRLATLSPGLVFGEMAWIERSQRSATVTADVDSACYLLDIADFDDLAASHSHIKVKVQENLLRIFARNLRKANGEIRVLS